MKFKNTFSTFIFSLVCLTLCNLSHASISRILGELPPGVSRTIKITGGITALGLSGYIGYLKGRIDEHSIAKPILNKSLELHEKQLSKLIVAKALINEYEKERQSYGIYGNRDPQNKFSKSFELGQEESKSSNESLD